jgi:hypothetical protein
MVCEGARQMRQKGERMLTTFVTERSACAHAAPFVHGRAVFPAPLPRHLSDLFFSIT